MMKRILMLKSCLACRSGEVDEQRSLYEAHHAKGKSVDPKDLKDVHFAMELVAGQTYVIGHKANIEVHTDDARELVRLGQAFDPDDEKNKNHPKPPEPRKRILPDVIDKDADALPAF